MVIILVMAGRIMGYGLIQLDLPEGISYLITALPTNLTNLPTLMSLGSDCTNFNSTSLLYFNSLYREVREVGKVE